ncbi:MAG: histidine phosphatase family protein [Planctomycetaceae bacterium]|nr:histidine phosphatase family protein [Planctomycetaceae bacterium]
MSTAILIRPGETDFDQQARIQGGLDLPLTENGRRQVRELIVRLADMSIDIVYASPTEPALSTAREIAASLDVSLKELEGLENLSHGLWEGMLLDDVKRKHPRVYKQWRDAPAAVCPPEGETCSEAHERVRKVLKKPLRKRQTFAIVAPEPVATLIASVLRGQDPCLPGPVCGCSEQQRIEVIDAVIPVNGRLWPLLGGADTTQAERAATT